MTGNQASIFKRPKLCEFPHETSVTAQTARTITFKPLAQRRPHPDACEPGASSLSRFHRGVAGQSQQRSLTIPPHSKIIVTGQRYNRIMSRGFELQSYHGCQIALHWLIAVLVAVQYVTGGSIDRTHKAVAHGNTPESVDLILHAIHNRTGFVVFGLMVVRAVARALLGTPRPPFPDRNWRSLLTRTTHASFYLILFAQALTGVTASYFFLSVGLVHVALSKLLLALIALHALAATWHFFIKHDGIMERMVPLKIVRNWRSGRSKA